MDPHATSHADEHREAANRRLRIVAAAVITLVVGLALAASGGLNYAGTAFGKPEHKGAAAAQYQYLERPGWGCGARTHVHPAPPGRQYAPPPPGCSRKASIGPPWRRRP